MPIPGLLRYAVLAALCGAPDDQADLKAAVQTFFAAAAKKDAPAAMAVWSPKSHQFEAIRECVAEAPTAITDFGAGAFTVQDDVATATVRFKGRLTGEDGKYADETTTLWRAEFHREAGGWRWFDLEPEGFVLARELLALDGPKERRAHLESRKAGVGTRVVSTLVETAVGLLSGGDLGAMLQAVDAALEAADLVDRDDLRLSALMMRGVCLTTRSKPGDALAPLKRSKELAGKIKDLESLSLAGSWLAFSLMDSGRPDEALGELAEALKLAEAEKFEEATFIARNFTGMVHGRLGATGTALLWHRRAVKTAEAMKRPDLLIQALAEVGRICWDAGDFGGALDASLSGLKLAEAPEEAPVRLKLLNTLGLIYASSAEYPKARERLESALALAEELKLPRTVGSILVNLAEVHRHERRYPEAAERLESAVKILEEAGDLPVAVASRNNLGTVHLFQGKLDQAMAQFKACAQEAGRLRYLSLQISAMTNIAEVHLLRGEIAEATTQLEAVLPIAEKGGSPPQRFSVHACIGQACLLRGGPGDLERAVASLRKAAAALEGSRSGLRDPALQQSFLSRHAPVYSMLAGVLHDLKRDPEAFAACEEAKARTLVDLLDAGSVRIVKSMTEEERREESRQDAALRTLLQKLDAATLTDDRTALEEQISKARAVLEEYRRGIFARHPELAGLRGRFTPATLEELNRRLLSGPPRSAVLSYLLGSSEILLFVVTPGKETATLAVHRIPVTLEKLKADVEAFWSSCSVADGEYRAGARALHQMLIGPAEKALEDVEHVVIIPDGVLNALPFQALQDGSGKHLAERWSLSFAPSATALLKMGDVAAQRRAVPSKDLPAFFVVGAPEMPPGFGDLAHAKVEAEALAKRYRVTALTGAAATETAVKPALEKARRIHIATHGKVDEASPLYSFVVLARDGENDGLLHAREIADLNLRADLVVLSACETALGKQIRGEGVVGLTWALFAAGTPATVLSQWQVSDESTGQLMEAFYAGMGPGVEFAAALRKAQLRLLKDPKRAHPYYWAPFILIGAGRG